MRDGHHRQGGFTLTEVLIGMSILAIISVALGGTFLVGYQSLRAEANQLAADKALSSASLPLLRDLSSATTITTNQLPLTPGSGGSVQVNYGSPTTTVTYTIDTSSNLTRSVGGTSAVAARGLQSLNLTQSGCLVTLTLTPSALAGPTTLQIAQRPGASGCF